MRQTLSKKERLSSKKDIGLLMKAGRWGVCGGLKFCYLTGGKREDAAKDCSGTADVPLNRIMVSVPKRFFKRAVKRNLLKRRIRESYRRRKFLLKGAGSTDIMFQYNTSEILPYEHIDALVSKILGEIASKGA